MDASDVSESQGVMIALLPTSTDWSKIDLPHLTLVYAGTKDSLKPGDFNELAKDACSIAMLAGPVSLKIVERTIFGDDEKVDVYRLMPSSELWAMRRQVERWNASKHSFNPHVTIGPAEDFSTRFSESDTPRYISFDRIMVGWGDDSITFWLKKSGY